MWRSSHSNSTTFELRTFLSRFEIRRIFSRTRRRIRTSGLHDRHHMSTPTGHRNNQLNKCVLHLHVYFRTSSVSLFFIFCHRHVNVWLNSHSNGFVLWIRIQRMQIFLDFVTSLVIMRQLKSAMQFTVPAVAVDTSTLTSVTLCTPMLLEY